MKYGDENSGLSTLLMVKTAEFVTFSTGRVVIFFSPSKSRNDSKDGGAFIAGRGHAGKR